MTTKVRKQIYLEPTQDVQLKLLSQATGLSEAEIIRQTLDSRLGTPRGHIRDLAAWERELQFIEQWIAKGPVEGGRTWRREDLYER